MVRQAAARGLGFPFIVQYTINGYPRSLEYSVVDPEKSVGHARRIAGEYGPRAVVWRYDTILSSSLTPRDFHRRNFEQLAAALAGSTDEAVISFAQIYRKTRRNLQAAAEASGFTWNVGDDEEKRSLAAELAACAGARGIQLTICSEERFLGPGIEPARCIDSARLSAVAGRPIAARRKGNRPECACDESRDIGDYDTCPHGCVYCYAVRTRALARRRYRAHDPAGEFLYPPGAPE